MKKFFILANILLGGFLIVVVALPSLAGLFIKDDYPGAVFYPGSHSWNLILQKLALLIGSVALAILSVASAAAFQRNKRWGAIALPLPPLFISGALFYVLFTSSPSGLAYVGGIMMLMALALLGFSALEILYLVFRKTAPLGAPDVGGHPLKFNG